MVIFYVFVEVELYRNENDGILLYLTFEEVCYFRTLFLKMHHKPRLNLQSGLL